MGAAFAVPAIGAGGATASAVYLYVDNASTAHCSDKGTGTTAQPYCTVNAAAAAAVAGQTVLVSFGTGVYPQELDITRGGTAAEPITFEGLPAPGEGAGGGSGYPQIGNNSGAPTSTTYGIQVKGAQNVVVDNFQPQGADGGIAVTDGSKNVTVARNLLQGGNGIQVSDSTGTVVTTNDGEDMLATPVQVSASPGTVVTSNTLTVWCSDDLVFDAASSGSVVENNILDTATTGNDGDPAACPAGSEDTAIVVPSGSTAGTKVAYNLIGTASGGPAYQWGADSYSSLADFTAASGQGSHDILGGVDTIVVGGEVPVAAIDSADATAPGEMTTDFRNSPRVDDRTVANTGTGPGYWDRGANEQLVGGSYQPLAPVRVLDTRSRIGVATTTPVAPGGTLTIALGSHVPALADDVVLNVTVTGGTAPGALKVTPALMHGPAGDPVTTAQAVDTNLTWSKGEVISNLVNVAVSGYRLGGPRVADTPVTFTNMSKGTVHVVADLEGYYSETAPDGYTTAGPVRLLDTRAATSPTKGKPLGSGSVLALPVTNRNGVPANATAVVLNVTVTDPTSSGYLTVYPAGGKVPVVSNLNFGKNQTLPNLVVVPVGAGGTIDFYNHSSSVHVVADLEGYYSTQGLATFQDGSPLRFLDTTAKGGLPTGTTALAAGASLTLNLENAIPGGAGDTASTAALAFSVTVVSPARTGYLTVYPYGAAQPLSSNANWTAGQSVTSLVEVPVKDGEVVLTNHSLGTINLYGDFEGLFVDF